MIDSETLDRIAEALHDSERVDSRRIHVAASDDAVVLQGAVATPEEASAATLLAEQHADDVRSELLVDPNLREGIVDPVAAEPAVTAENEIPVGDVDMLAGPDARLETDLSRALEENVPWDPPTEPQLAVPESEYRSDVSEGSPEPIEEASPEGAAPEELAAADLSAEELRAEGGAPALDPDRVAPPAEAQPDPVGVEGLGGSPPDEPEPMVEQVPGTAKGPGAVGEPTTGGGTLGGEPATETGATGADTAAADPARSTGGTMTDAGTERGPQAREDEPLREDFPERDPDAER